MTSTRQYLTAKQFQRWLNEMKMTTTDAAERLGITTRAVQRYVDGTRPVSKVVALAMAAVGNGVEAWR